MTIERARYDDIAMNVCVEKGVFPWESREHHVRRLLDPLEVAFADPAERQKILGMASEGLSTSLRRGNFPEAVEFAADFAYRAFGVTGAKEVTAATSIAHAKAGELLERDNDLTPAERLALNGRQLDMVSLGGFSRYLGGKEGRTPAEEAEAFETLMGIYKGILRRSGSLLMEAVATYASLDDFRQREKLGGRIFELLYSSIFTT